MEAYKERMIEEYKQLKERYNKLHRLLVKYDAGTLDFTLNCPVDLLRRQAEAMWDYLYILEVRAEIEGVPLEDLGESVSAEPIDASPIDLSPFKPIAPIPTPRPVEPIKEDK